MYNYLFVILQLVETAASQRRQRKRAKTRDDYRHHTDRQFLSQVATSVTQSLASNLRPIWYVASWQR